MILKNLILISFVWVSASFCYYLISFQLKYIHGDIYINTIVSSSSEVVSYGTSGVILGYLGMKNTLTGSLIMAMCGMLCLILVKEKTQLFLAFFILFSKFGIS